MLRVTTCLFCCLLAAALFGQPNTALRTLLDTDDAATWRTQLTYLQGQPLGNFDGESRDLLSDVLTRPEVQNHPEIVRLAGFVGVPITREQLHPEVKLTKSLKQHLKLASVRLGDEERRANLLENVRRYETSDDFVYTVVPLLVYTRQREVLDFLWELVMVDDNRCTTADAESNGRIPCAYRVVEYLGPAIVDFPVGVDDDHSLMTDDYEAALAEIRRWYTAHRTDYRINTETY